MFDIILICGVPGSGKTWVCEQLADSYRYVPQSDHFKNHFETLVKTARTPGETIITEVPFGERDLRDKLLAADLTVRVVFVVESIEVLVDRYYHREKRPLSQSSITRADHINQRALEWNCFAGTSQQVLDHLLLPSGRQDDSPSVTATLEAGAGKIAPIPAPLPPDMIKKVKTDPNGHLYIPMKTVMKMTPSQMAWMAKHAKPVSKLDIWILP